MIYVDWVTGGKVWGRTGGNVRGIVTKVKRGIRYNDESQRPGLLDDLERSGQGGRGWLTSVGGESGFGAKFAALTAGLRCQC